MPTVLKCLSKYNARRKNMKISARNQFQGKVTDVKPGAINTEVEISLGGDDKVIAQVTNTSAQRLGLAKGKAVTALVKASSILVMTDANGVALSARNILTGKVTKLSSGQVAAEITIALPSGANVYATITHDAVSELGIKEGIKASGVFKASSVILGVAS
jgi:molybdate transport system regulatory protein